MFILSSISSGVEFWSVNYTSIFENSELKVFMNIKFLGEICSTRFFYKKNVYKKMSLKNTKNLKEMLRKCQALNALAAIFKNADFS